MLVGCADGKDIEVCSSSFLIPTILSISNLVFGRLVLPCLSAVSLTKSFLCCVHVILPADYRCMAKFGKYYCSVHRLHRSTGTVTDRTKEDTTPQQCFDHWKLQLRHVQA